MRESGVVSWAILGAIATIRLGAWTRANGGHKRSLRTNSDR